MGNEDYKEEFEEEDSLGDFHIWMATNLEAFVENMQGKFGRKPLHEWIEIFLLWSEYEDYRKAYK